MLIGAVLALALANAYEEPASARCEVAAQHVATLGDEDGPGAVGTTLHLRRDSRGRFYTTGGQFSGVIQVFHPNGRYSHSFGRLGEGPGEFRGISGLQIGAGDSIVVFDSGNLRLTVLSPDGRYVRNQRLPFRTMPGGALLLADGRMVLNANAATREGAGLLLHLLDADGTLVRSFGALEPSFDARNLLAALRTMTISDPATLWTAASRDYSIEAWRLTDGRRIRAMDVRRQWWQPARGNSLFAPDRPPPSQITGLWFDHENGVLLVLANRAGPEWRGGLELRREREGDFWLPADWGAVYNTMVEVLDPATGRLLGSVRLPHYVRGFVDKNLIFSYRERADGTPFLDVWRLAVTGCSG